MIREMPAHTTAVVVILDGDTEAGRQLARRKLADGHRVVVVARHAADVVEVMHGHSADRVMVIAADVSDPRQWSRLTARVTARFGQIDGVVRADGAVLRSSA